MPETTGDTENGRSMSVVKKALPGNSYFATHQAAAMPKTRLSGTAIAATSKVKRMAACDCGSPKAMKYSPAPLRKASTKTRTSGRTMTASKKTTAIPISVRLIQSRSVVGRVCA
jgi:hypothetical protein